MYCVADTAQRAVSNLQLAFNVLQAALVKLRLVLNASKTKFMIFTRARTAINENLSIKSTDGSTIERVSEYKYLSIWLDDTFSFKVHIDNLITKLRQKNWLSV